MGQIKIRYAAMIMVMLFFSLTACGLSNLLGEMTGGDEEPVEGVVQSTLTAIALAQHTDMPKVPTLTQPAEATPTATIPPSPGTISGDLYYPSEGIPPLRIVAFNVQNVEQYVLKEVTSVRTYSLEVPPGSYYVLAYLIDPGVIDQDFSGAFSQFVVCGMEPGCEDHTLLPVEVAPGEVVKGIDLADWYLPVDQSGEWPIDPTRSGTGAIQGSLGYPSEYIPPLRVVAFDIHSQDFYYVDTQRNQVDYLLENLPAGTYHVVAYVREEGPDIPGAYTEFVTCGQTVECTDHSLIDVVVSPGTVMQGVDPVDFYAQLDEVDWPENPTQ